MTTKEPNPWLETRRLVQMKPGEVKISRLDDPGIEGWRLETDEELRMRLSTYWMYNHKEGQADG